MEVIEFVFRIRRYPMRYLSDRLPIFVHLLKTPVSSNVNVVVTKSKV